MPGDRRRDAVDVGETSGEPGDRRAAAGAGHRWLSAILTSGARRTAGVWRSDRAYTAKAGWFCFTDQPIYSSGNIWGRLVRALPHQGTMWECPSFFPLGDRWVLIYSPIPTHKVFYMVGDYRKARFTPEYEGQVDWGGDFYAPHVMTDAAGRRIMFGWSWEARNGTPKGPPRGAPSRKPVGPACRPCHACCHSPPQVSCCLTRFQRSRRCAARDIGWMNWHLRRGRRRRCRCPATGSNWR